MFYIHGAIKMRDLECTYDIKYGLKPWSSFFNATCMGVNNYAESRNRMIHAYCVN